MGTVPPSGPGDSPSPEMPRTSGNVVPPHTPKDPSYTPRMVQYNSPVVTVNRNLANMNKEEGPSMTTTSQARSSISTQISTPPFIISNSLAAASGLHPRRSPAVARTPAPAAHLPPHKDLLEGDQDLGAHRAIVKQRMHSALQEHHDRVLKPDVTTPFRDVQDVVDRLLPYHVWQAPEKDLLTAMEARWTPPDDEQDLPVTFHVPYKRKRAQDECAEDTLYLPTFPETKYSLSVYRRRAVLLKQFAALQTRANTSHLRAPETNTSLEHLERMAYEDEMRDTQELSNELRRLRAQLEEVERQRNWRFGVPAAASLNPPPPTDRGRGEWSSPWAARRFAAAPSGYASPSAGAVPATSGSSVPINTSPITRPYLATNPAMARAPVVAGSAASLPTLTHAVVSHLANLTAGSSSPAPSTPIPAPPQPLLSHADSKTPTIPTQPLPLVMPISAVPRLTALGINLVPASHLIPALSLASAGQSIALNPGLTAPRPVVGVQEEPVLLVGITDAPHLGNGSSGPANASRQRLHLSVVLAKLRAEQLSGLALLMQTLQGEEANALSGSNSKPT